MWINLTSQPPGTSGENRRPEYGPGQLFSWVFHSTIEQSLIHFVYIVSRIILVPITCMAIQQYYIQNILATHRFSH